MKMTGLGRPTMRCIATTLGRRTIVRCDNLPFNAEYVFPKTAFFRLSLEPGITT